jgi:hypothetical protein
MYQFSLSKQAKKLVKVRLLGDEPRRMLKVVHVSANIAVAIFRANMLVGRFLEALPKR